MPFFSNQAALGRSRPPPSTGPTCVPPTAIPFVTPASPFVPPHHPLHLPPPPPPPPALSTTNSSSTTRASPFSSPPPPPSTSVSPISHPPHAQDLAAALQQQQQAQGQTPLDPSHPSVPSSPHPSLPSTQQQQHLHPLGRSPPHHSSNHSNPSHTHMYYHYPPHQGLTDADPPQLLAQAPLQPPTTTHPALQGPGPQSLSLQDMGQYQAWAQAQFAQSYRFALPSDMDGSGLSSPYAESAAAMEAARMHHHHRPQEETSRRLPAEQTTLRFPSTHPHQAPPPTTQPQPGTRRTPPQPSHANDLTLDLTTTTMGHASAEMLAGPLAAGSAPAPNTTTAQNLGPSLDGSPSWKDRKSTRLNSSHSGESRMPSSA